MIENEDVHIVSSERQVLRQQTGILSTMLFIRCYDIVFSVEGADNRWLETWLNQRGLRLEEATPAAEALVHFRFEKTDTYYNLYLDGQTLVRQQPLNLAAEVMLSRLHLHVAFHNPDLTFLRADAARMSHGTLLVAGDAFSGKTYLVNHLGKSDSETLCTHYTVLNDSGEVLRYPSANRPTSGQKATTLAVLSYRPRSEWEAQSATPGEMAMHLTTHLDGQQNCVVTALPRLAILCSEAKARWMGARGEAGEAASILSKRH